MLGSMFIAQHLVVGLLSIATVGVGNDCREGDSCGHKIHITSISIQSGVKQMLSRKEAQISTSVNGKMLSAIVLCRLSVMHEVQRSKQKSRRKST